MSSRESVRTVSAPHGRALTPVASNIGTSPKRVRRVRGVKPAERLPGTKATPVTTELISKTALITGVGRDIGPVHSQHLLVATGRCADLKALGVGAAGIDDTQPFIAVDDFLRAADGVWSAGDVTGAGAFTHIAILQARIAASDILGQAHEPASYRALPRVTFTDPEVGAVGLTEAQARGRKSPCRLFASPGLASCDGQDLTSHERAEGSRRNEATYRCRR